MSIVHWELFRMSPLNDKFDGLHELPYQKELGSETPQYWYLHTIEILE